MDEHSTPTVATAAVPPAAAGWQNPGRPFLPAFAFAAVGAGMANIVPLVLTLPLKAAMLDEAGATGVLSLVAAVGAVAAILSFPLLGRLSDRTVSGAGRRRPFLLAGAVLYALGAIGYVAAPNVGLLVLAGVISAVAYSCVMVAVTALIPDMVAPDRRGGPSAVVGLSVPVGVVVGLFVAQLVAPNFPLMVLLPAAFGVVGPLVLVAVLRETPLPAELRPAFDLRQILGAYWVDVRRHPAFGWAWLSRLLLYLGVAAVQAYQAFYLIKVIGVPPQGVAGAIFVTTLVLTAFALVFAPVAGRLSDRIGRRKPFVIGAAVVFGAGLVLAATATSFTAFAVSMAVIGLGQGVYFAVDVALVTEVLPDPANPAKDLGITNLANTLPTAIVPAVAPLVLLIGASAATPENYPALFLFGALVSLVGAACIVPIRGVR